MWARKYRFRYIASILALLTAAGLSVAASSPPKSAPSTAATSSTKSIETSQANQFADAINLVGTTKYVNSFAGAEPISGSEVRIYATRGDAALLKAVTKLPHSGVRTTVKTVAYSYAALEKTTNQLARDASGLAKSGVQLQAWGPDPETDTVNVTLRTPAGSPTAGALATTVSSARSVISRSFGGIVSVASATSPIAQSAQTPCCRDDDYAPYWAGDGIYVSGLSVDCTSGWSTTGNASGDSFILSAGHCGSGTVYQEYTGGEMGTVATQYLDALNGDEMDFETIRASGAAAVWYGAPDSGSDLYYPVAGLADPAVGTDATVDGDVSGEHTDNYVSMYDGCLYVNGSSEGYGTYLVCNAGEVTHSSRICYYGDSGGPVYVRTSNGEARAAGTIVAIDTTSGSVGYDCYFQELHTELGAANLSLDTA